MGYFPFIISADSRQIYTMLDIGTGKILPNEMQWIEHIWLDIINPTETFSVVDFQKKIENEHLWNNFIQYPNKFIPIICWWTGLYIDSLIFKRNYLGHTVNKKRREELENFRIQNGNEALWQKLFAIDPKYAQELHPNNHTYIIRAIEIFEQTGTSKKESEQPLTLKFPTLFLTPYNDTSENREQLYTNINHRIEHMFANGLVSEVENIKNIYWKNIPALKTIWYKEIMSFFNNEISLEEAKELIQKHNRNYAKRQITWNKKYIPFLEEYKNEHL